MQFNFLHKNKLDIVRRVQFLTGRRRPMRSFSPGPVVIIALWKSDRAYASTAADLRPGSRVGWCRRLVAASPPRCRPLPASSPASAASSGTPSTPCRRPVPLAPCPCPPPRCLPSSCATAGTHLNRAKQTLLRLPDSRAGPASGPGPTRTHSIVHNIS